MTAEDNFTRNSILCSVMIVRSRAYSPKVVHASSQGPWGRLSSDLIDAPKSSQAAYGLCGSQGAEGGGWEEEGGGWIKENANEVNQRVAQGGEVEGGGGGGVRACACMYTITRKCKLVRRKSTSECRSGRKKEVFL